MSCFGTLLNRFAIIRVQVPGDGHCFFHSVMLGCVKKYIDTPEHRTAIVVSFRNSIADYLHKKLPNGKTIYESLSRGKLVEYASIIPEYSLESLTKLLRSNACVGLEVLEVTSLVLDINIIIWDAYHADVYRHGDKELLFKPHRSTIVILYEPGHYSLLGIKSPNGAVTHFTTDNAFIQALDQMW